MQGWVGASGPPTWPPARPAWPAHRRTHPALGLRARLAEKQGGGEGVGAQKGKSPPSPAAHPLTHRKPAFFLLFVLWESTLGSWKSRLLPGL